MGDRWSENSYDKKLPWSPIQWDIYQTISHQHVLIFSIARAHMHTYNVMIDKIFFHHRMQSKQQPTKKRPNKYFFLMYAKLEMGKYTWEMSQSNINYIVTRVVLTLTFIHHSPRYFVPRQGANDDDKDDEKRKKNCKHFHKEEKYIAFKHWFRICCLDLFQHSRYIVHTEVDTVRYRLLLLALSCDSFVKRSHFHRHFAKAMSIRVNGTRRATRTNTAY